MTSNLSVAPIVEGHGEYEAIRGLLSRIWVELLGGGHLDVLRPIRQPRSKLARPASLRPAIALAVKKLRSSAPSSPKLVLVLVDADEDCPRDLASNLREWGKEAAGGEDFACVVANVEYETWFVAAAESLEPLVRLGPGERAPTDPERDRLGKGWISRRFTGPKYSPTTDQPKLTARMDLAACRTRSRSFDKLCRELEARRE